MTQASKPTCRYCGEETGGEPGSSFCGFVHKWGPTMHKFTPRKSPAQDAAPRVVAECWTCSDPRRPGSLQPGLPLTDVGSCGEYEQPGCNHLSEHRAAGHDVRPVRGKRDATEQH